jgi:hypothetical protein
MWFFEGRRKEGMIYVVIFEVFQSCERENSFRFDVRSHVIFWRKDGRWIKDAIFSDFWSFSKLWKGMIFRFLGLTCEAIWFCEESAGDELRMLYLVIFEVFQICEGEWFFGFFRFAMRSYVIFWRKGGRWIKNAIFSDFWSFSNLRKGMVFRFFFDLPCEAMWFFEGREKEEGKSEVCA